MADPSPFGGGELLRVAVARTRVEHAPERQRGPLTATLVVSLAVQRALDVVVAGGGVPAAARRIRAADPGRRRDTAGPDRAALGRDHLVDLLLGLAALAICGIPPRLRALRSATAIA
jgi:hypothetical protein